MIPSEAAVDQCGIDDRGCVTCGDVAVPLNVVATTPGGDAECVDAEGRTLTVATDLVGPVEPGARILVHAGVAIALLGQEVPAG